MKLVQHANEDTCTYINGIHLLHWCHCIVIHMSSFSMVFNICAAS